MGKYSTDSDSDHSSSKHRRKYRRSRSISSSSDSSSPHRRKSRHYKSKRRYRSRTRSRDRDKGTKSSRYSRVSSRDREKQRYNNRSRHPRSLSLDRNSRRKKRSVSREKSTSRSSSPQSIPKSNVPVEKTSTVQIRDEFLIEPVTRIAEIEEINAEGFAPKQFSSTNQETKLKNIVIDIETDTIQVPVTPASAVADSIFHTSLMLDQDVKFDKWVKKLYSLRQKAMSEAMQVS